MHLLAMFAIISTRGPTGIRTRITPFGKQTLYPLSYGASTSLADEADARSQACVSQKFRSVSLDRIEGSTLEWPTWSAQ